MLSNHSLVFEQLDSRVLLSAVLGTGADVGTLFIDGTAGSDSLSVRAVDSRLQVRLNGGLSSFAAADVSTIQIQTFDGADVVDLAGLSVPSYVNAGAGNDLVQGGGANDSLTGAAGKDSLLGGAGDDLLQGGNTADILRGEAGNDRLLGGAGDDKLYGGAGADRYDGGDGEDFADPTSEDAVLLGSIEHDDLVDAGTTGESGGLLPSAVTKTPIAISFNDEALFDANFSTAVAQAKALGVKSVRLWMPLNSYADRPKAWDNVTMTDVVNVWKGTSFPLIAGMTMRRAFDLKAAGFSVLVTVSMKGGNPPTTTDQVKQLFTYLMNAPKAAGSTTLLKSAIDYWEIGNEVDLAKYWNPSGTNKATGLASYVDKFLIPAAEVLHSGASTSWENVISGSVSYSANDLYTILNTLKSRGKLGAIDGAGFHPYGRYDPTDASIPNEIAQRTAQAVTYSKQFAKPLVATEWNVRGYPTNGSRNATWAQAIDKIYRNTILPNYAIGYYFALVNNFAARGGTVTARPAGLLKHNTTMTISPSSSVADMVKWYQTPLVKADPFYTTFNAW
jgi:hypothetical protein